ncbi:retrovirus-related pol polyprotein from transposon TNT 1-94 [Tanacetum coccineum]
MYPSNYNNNRNGMHGVEETVIDKDENAEEYAYHLEQATNFMENQLVYESRQEDIRRPVPRPLIFFGPQRNQNEPPRYLYNKDLFFLKNGNTKEKKYILSLHKIHIERFPKADLEEKMNRWVRKEFKNFNKDAWLSIQHWKDSWHKRVYKQNQRRVKNNPEDYFSNHRITEVVRITTDQPHGLDFMEQIIVMRENDKLDSFSEADFKYLNKNDIEDLYYLYRNKKLGIKSYQVKVNLTAPTLTFPGIEAHEPYSIVDKPTTSLIYLNSKDEKRVMYLVEIVKFCDATLEKVLKEIKLKIFQSEPRKKPPLLGANERPPMLEKWNYITCESRFRRFLDNKLEEGDQMWRSIEKGPYVRPMIPNPDKPTKQLLEPLSKMTEGNKKQYIADVRVMNYLLQAIPNDICTIQWMRAKMLRICRNELKGDVVSYDQLYDSLVQFEPHVQASKANKAAKNHDPLALLAHSNASSSQSYANSSYSPQPYYVTHPSSVADYEDEYQGELQGDSQEDKLTTAMMLLARAITQKFSTPTNNRLCTSSNTRNQAVIKDGRVDIQTKNVGYGGNGNRIAGRKNRNQAFNAGTGNDESNQIVQRVPRTELNPGKANVHCYNCNEKGHYAGNCHKPSVRDAKYFREQMLLAMKDEAGSNLKDEENEFMLDNSYGDETLEELTAAVIMMARIPSVDDNVASEPSYDAKVVSEVNASTRVHEQVNRVQRKTIIHTSDDDQIDSNIIFDDPYVENNGGTFEHDSTAHNENHDIKMLAYNVQREAKNKK